MTFKSAYIRLTFFYVFIVMIISVAFSLIIYELSYQELGRGLGKQVRTICDHPNGSQQCAPPMELERIRLAQLDESRGNIVSGLVYFNVLILVLSSAVSYLLAKRTLQPIEQMMEAQNRFTADASHELKTPLTAIRSEIEVNLRDGKMSLSEAKKLLASNLEEVSKLEGKNDVLTSEVKRFETARTKWENEKQGLIKRIQELETEIDKLIKKQCSESKSQEVS